MSISNELGKGFCFEACQKLLSGEHFVVDGYNAAEPRSHMGWDTVGQ